MNRIVKEITTRVIAVVIIAATGLLVINAGLFTHTHYLADGSIFSHAHPYNKSEEQSTDKSHSHTQSELLFLQALGILFILALPSTAIMLYGKKAEFLIDFNDRFSSLPMFFRQGRAPPLLGF